VERRWWLVLVVILTGVVMGALPARAQEQGDKIELSAGYSYMHFGSTPKVNLNGAELSGQYKLSDWLGIVGDVTGEYGQVAGVSSRVYTYVFGPQLTWPKPRKLTPFAHLLVGGSHFDGGGFASKGLAWDIGIGADYRLRGPWSWRVIQADIFPTHLGGDEEHNTRVSTSIVLRF
jgi:hypothetical protein